jgi:hypothetical protein
MTDGSTSAVLKIIARYCFINGHARAPGSGLNLTKSSLSQFFELALLTFVTFGEEPSLGRQQQFASSVYKVTAIQKPESTLRAI